MPYTPHTIQELTKDHPWFKGRHRAYTIWLLNQKLNWSLDLGERSHEHTCGSCEEGDGPVLTTRIGREKRTSVENKLHTTLFTPSKCMLRPNRSLRNWPSWCLGSARQTANTDYLMMSSGAHALYWSRALLDFGWMCDRIMKKSSPACWLEHRKTQLYLCVSAYRMTVGRPSFTTLRLWL